MQINGSDNCGNTEGNMLMEWKATKKQMMMYQWEKNKLETFQTMVEDEAYFFLLLVIQKMEDCKKFCL